MLNNRRQAAQEVANRLIAAEFALDVALQRTAELTGYLPQARIEAQLASEVGHSALERATATLAVLLQARGELIETHKELARTKAAVGLRTFALGGLSDKTSFQLNIDPIIKVAA